MSFNEGNTSNTLEITSKKKIDFIENSDFLANSLIDQSQNEYIYRLSFNNKKELQEFKKKIEEEKNIHKVNVNFN